jgi:hypothetical protein
MLTAPFSKRPYEMWPVGAGPLGLGVADADVELDEVVDGGPPPCPPHAVSKTRVPTATIADPHLTMSDMVTALSSR